MSVVTALAASALGAAASAVSALFLTTRLLLWALGVVAAWYEIIEKHDLPPRKRPGQVISLTASALRQHDTEEAAAAVVTPDRPPRRWPAHIPPIAGVSEMGEDESVDQWPIWGEGHPVQEEAAAEVAPAPALPAAPPAHAADAADAAADEQRVLAATTMGGNVDLVKEPPKEVVRAAPGGGAHKVKKPFFARKVEKWFVAPYAQKYERVGYMMYKGAMRVEKGVNVLSKDLDASIRVAGVAAVDRVEATVRRYIKFFGAVTILAVLLLPLPAVHLHVGVA